MPGENNIKFLSANCQGLPDKAKRFDVLTYMKSLNANIIYFQDTHLIRDDISSIKKLWNGQCLIHGTKTNSRGVVILFNTGFEYKILKTDTDEFGNFLMVQVNICGSKILLINIYSPNSDKPEFYDDTKDKIGNVDFDQIKICGDLNLFLDPKLECDNYINISNPKARTKVKSMLNTLNSIDVYRKMHPEKKHYTWRRHNPFKQAQLHYFLVSNSLADMITKADIIPGYRSDHSIIEINVTTCKFTRGKGLWKLNTSLLKDSDFLTLVNKTIDTEITNYALPVYNMNTLKDLPQSDIEFTIKDDLFFEVLLMKIRGGNNKIFIKA